jgi:uncharacterized membrane protein
MWKTLPFLIMLLAVAFTLAFPEPKDFLPATNLVSSESAEGLQSTVSAPSVQSLARNTPAEPYVSRIEQSGCLDQLALLPEDIIESCSQLVAEAVIQVAEYEKLDENNLTTESGLLVERLRLAAANVCRARWINEPGLTFDNDDPVCIVSTINLASSE